MPPCSRSHCSATFDSRTPERPSEAAFPVSGVHLADDQVPVRVVGVVVRDHDREVVFEAERAQGAVGELELLAADRGLTGRPRRGEVRTVCKCRSPAMFCLVQRLTAREGSCRSVEHVLSSRAVDTGQSPVAMAKARNCAEAQHQCKWSSRYAPRRSLKCLTKSAVSER